MADRARQTALSALDTALANLEDTAWADTLLNPANNSSDPWYGFERDIAQAKANRNSSRYVAAITQQSAVAAAIETLGIAQAIADQSHADQFADIDKNWTAGSSEASLSFVTTTGNTAPTASPVSFANWKSPGDGGNEGGGAGSSGQSSKERYGSIGADNRNWFQRTWATLKGRLQARESLVEDPRSYTVLDLGDLKQITVPGHSGSLSHHVWGNLYHRSPLGALVDKSGHWIVNPVREARESLSETTQAIQSIPHLPQIFSSLPDYQRQDLVINSMLGARFGSLAIFKLKPPISFLDVRSKLGHVYAAKILPGGTGRALEGHGEWPYSKPMTIVPEGTYIRLPAPNLEVPDAIAGYIASGRFDLVRSIAEFDPDVAEWFKSLKTYGPGEAIPDYNLLSPDSFNKPLTIYENSTTVDRATPLSKLLEPNMGHVEWAACTKSVCSD